jgi:FAD dependent oxidoreductase
MKFPERFLIATLLILCAFSAGAEDRGTPPAALKDRYDVIIAGAGTGGFGAAVQAARLGASVLIVEETDWIGGQMNAAAVTSMDEGATLVRERGLYHEFVEAVNAHYEALGISAETAYWGSHICLEPRVGQDILYAMLAKARAKTSALDISLRSKVTKVRKSGDTVTGVEVAITTQGGQIKETRTFQSKILVDATEWGDVIPLTGARYRVGNCMSDAIDPARHIQDATWTAVIKQYPHGVPAELQIPQPPPGYTDKIAQSFAKTLVPGGAEPVQTKPWTFTTFLGYRAMPNSEQPAPGPVTRTHMNYNNDYPLTVADVEDPAARIASGYAMRLKTLHLLYYVQQTLGHADWSVADDEGYDSPFNREEIDRWIQEKPELAPYRPILHHFSVMAYARESRRIVGLHTLTATEIDRKNGTTPKLFSSAVAIADYPMDLHGASQPKWLELDLDRAEDAPTAFGSHGEGPFPIPFECFIPEKVDGFLAAEKNFSQSRLANGATRLQPSTMLEGQAVGAIAALAIRHGIQPRDLDPALVQSELLDDGDTLYAPVIKDISKRGWEWKPVQLVAVHGLLKPEAGRFSPAQAVTDTELAAIVKSFTGQDAPSAPAANATPVTRGQFAEAIRTALATVQVSLIGAPPAPEQPISRLEAAQILAPGLELRALATTTRQPQTLAWPALREATLVTAEDRDPELAKAIHRLVDRHIIESPDYWLAHATEGEKCDGVYVRALLQKSASLLQPGSDPTKAVEVCSNAGILGSVDYWEKSAVDGGKCDGKNVATILRRISQRVAQVRAE